MGSGYSKMKKQAKAMQEQVSKMQEEMESKRITGSAGNGLVEITLDGNKKMLEVKINPDCIDKDDVEGLQDLILAAYEQAANQADENSPENLLSGSLPFGF